MGQYYYVYTKRNGKEKVYNRTVDGEYTMAKLMEHSWWLNPFVNTICYKIHNKPTQIAWVGDYVEPDEFEPLDRVWGDKAKTYGVTEAQVVLHRKYLVNHTQKQYVDCSDYYKRCVIEDGWCIHPLPILTVIGNGRGGGDYRAKYGKEYVGVWANDEISVENVKPDGYEEIKPTFREDW